MESKEVTITAQTLFDMLRQERNRDEIQIIAPNFVEDVKKYLNEKAEILKSQLQKESIFSSTEVQRTRRELENIQKVLKELYEKRESKITKMALFHSRTNLRKEPEGLLKEEIAFYNSLINLFIDSKGEILHRMLNIEQEKPLKKDEPEPKDLKSNVNFQDDKVKLRFLEATPQFVGEDMQVYGPYESMNVAELPKEVAQLLINQKKAIEQ
ncbi:DNA replication complex GINS family protein [Candidatus Woesearchaeota archaeon]|nr:DNA replication complex GINS family protein [Candidatus Woesearchaeota archaeon]